VRNQRAGGLESSILTKSIRPKSKKTKQEYTKGEKAQKNFEETMKALFRSPKFGSKKPKKGKD
jgi:hypothetical protein